MGTYDGATKDQASIGKVIQRLKDGIPHYYARSPGHFSKIRGILTHGARMSEFRCGTLVGEDKYGNRYFENNDYTLGRNRWWIPHDRCTTTGVLHRPCQNSNKMQRPMGPKSRHTVCSLLYH